MNGQNFWSRRSRVKFIPRKNWFGAGSDDFQLRVFNYCKVAAFEVYPDYIRCLTVHPAAPIVLTGSDDIKLWIGKNIRVSARTGLRL